MQTEQARAEILEHWRERLGRLCVREPLNEKGTVFRVADDEGRSFVLKHVEHPERAGGIESQFRILRHLQQEGIPVAPPIRSDAGPHSVELADRIYTLSQYLPGGASIAAADLERAHRNIGRAIGRLHRALASYAYPIRSWTMDLTKRVFDQAVPITRVRLAPPERTRFERTLASIEDEMRSSFADLPVQYIHGDCHLGNLLLEEGEVSAFLDLDHLPLGPVVYDLGCALADMVKRKINDAEQTRRWRELAALVIGGYGETNALSGEEQKSIWPIMLAVQILFTEFFLEGGSRAEGQLNLDAFFWLAEQRKAAPLFGTPTQRQESPSCLQ